VIGGVADDRLGGHRVHCRAAQHNPMLASLVTRPRRRSIGLAAPNSVSPNTRAASAAEMTRAVGMVIVVAVVVSIRIEAVHRLARILHPSRSASGRAVPARVRHPYPGVRFDE
jgi:hypothetical protein